MNYLFWICVALSFTVSYSFGRWTKSFWSLFAFPLIGALISTPLFFVYIAFSNLERTGLGIIALVPVLGIVILFFNLASSFLGVVAGVVHAIIRDKNAHSASASKKVLHSRLGPQSP